jgi:hypothetical protein
MKTTEEIYAVRFNKVRTTTDMLSTTYTIDVPMFFSGGMVIPKSITLAKDKITTTFDDGTKHIIHYAEETELFIRTKKTKDTDGRDISTDVNKTSVR